MRGLVLRHLPTTLMCAALLQAEAARALPAIDEIRFDWSTYRALAPGSDIWALTWCEDDHQYTTWGDGGGFGGTNTEGRVSLGFARITGTYTGMQTLNLWGGWNPVTDAEFPGKVKSLLCLGGDLYGWRSRGSMEDAFDWKQLILSEDKGITWQEDVFPESYVAGCTGCPSLPYMINYGRNYGANQDGYVYTYWIELQDSSEWEVQVPGVLWLARAPAANRAFTDRDNWQWVTGIGSNNTPIWGTEANRVPVLEEPDGLMRGSALYVPGLGRYLMVQNHTARNSGNIVIWEAPKPWGPWTLILKEDDWPQSDPAAPVDPRFSFGNFSPKWFSADGRSGVFVWFGPDKWNSVEVDIVPVPEPGGVASWASGLLALAACARSRARRREHAAVSHPTVTER
jgi:hypothetical protein